MCGGRGTVSLAEAAEGEESLRLHQVSFLRLFGRRGEEGKK